MPTYRYKALRSDGGTERGELDGDSEAAVAAHLQQSGWLPVRITPASGPRLPRLRWSAARRVGVENLARELAVLLRAGLPLEQALEGLLEVAEEPAARRSLEDLLAAVRGGAPLSAAMAAQPEAFDAVEAGMVKAGEASGRLAEVLADLAGYLERARALRQGVVSALLYPAILLVVAVVSLLLLLGWVVPQFSSTFASLGGTLPLPTRIVIACGEWVRDWGWLIPTLLLLAWIGGRAALRERSRRLRLDAFLLRLPLVGPLLQRAAVARWARTLGVLTVNGVPLLEALQVTQASVANLALHDALASATAQLRAGRGLAQPLRESGAFPRLAVRMIAVGEESGELGPMLLQVAETYDGEVRTAVNRLLAVLEPALIIGLGALIAVIVLSLMLAITGTHELLF